MNAGLLLIPILLIRYGLLALISREALRRAAHFAPLFGKEQAAYWVYQLTTLGMFVILFFLTIRADSVWFYVGLGVAIAGAALYAAAVADYAKPGAAGVNTRGLYRVSRNPMYVAYFIYFLGCALMARSLILFAILLVYQAAAHFIILSEERWCLEQFGEAYREYMRRVRRYI
ncbi:MAG: isoprenylcysteine carboxylmethyltransferase family protein [Bacillota bacterium]